MVNKLLFHAVILLGLLLTLSSTSVAQEKRNISRKQVPAPIQEAFQKTFAGASIKKAEVEVKDGNLIYHLTGKRNGKEVESVYALEITLIEQQEDIPLSDLPATVAAAIKTAHPTAIITETEKITRNGILLGYEVELEEGKQKLELRLTPDGKILERKVD